MSQLTQVAKDRKSVFLAFYGYYSVSFLFLCFDLGGEEIKVVFY